MRHPTREELDRLDPDALEDVARSVLQALPLGWALSGMTPGTDRSAAHVLFARGEGTFAYLPGGECRIGFDIETWRPSAFEQESWRSSAEDWGFEGTVEEHVARTTTRPRSVSLAPLLVETRATLTGFETLDPSGDAARTILAATASGIAEATHGDTVYCFTTAADGARSVARKLPSGHAELCAVLARDGMRLPTSEEWEYACAAGTTLFPWGDHAPCDHYPIETSPSADDPERDPGFAPGWAGHRDPNRWGIHGPRDPYKPERIATPDMVRGGDGGATICGGGGYFPGWLPLAPSWFEDEICRSFVEGGWDDIDGLSRRVLPLD